MIIGAIGNMLMLFLKSFLAYFMEDFFSKMSLNPLKYFEMYLIKSFIANLIQNSKNLVEKLFIYEIKHTLKLEKDWIQAIYESF